MSLIIQRYLTSAWLLGGHFIEMFASYGGTRLITMTTIDAHFVISGGVPIKNCRELVISGSGEIVPGAGGRVIGAL